MVATVILDLFVPTGRATFGSEVKEIPYFVDGTGMTRILAGIAWSEEYLGGPEVPDLIAIAAEDGDERELKAFGRLGMIVAFEVVVGGREETEVTPATFLSVGGDAVDGSLGDDYKVEAGCCSMLRGAVE